jgi:peptidoglycan/LPS O-acetylase OafA/YrhL
MRRISQLDGLRALAVGLVVIDHVEPWFAGGGIGVCIFFVLSGFLITTLLLGELEKSDHISRRRFYTRRALRLYPALLVMLAVTLAMGVGNIKAVLVAATYTTNLLQTIKQYNPGPYGHTWSLALEEQFYLIWPLLLPLVMRLSRRAAVSVVLTASVASAAWAQLAIGSLIGKDGSISVAVFNPLFQVHGLLIGCALAFMIWHRAVPRAALLTNAGMIICIAVAVAASATVAWHWAAIWNLVSEFAAAALIAGLRDQAVGLGRLLTLKPVVWVGERSYAIYLWHLPLILFATEHGYGRSGEAVAVVLTIVVAGISWRVVEQPFLKLKKRFEPANEKYLARHREADGKQPHTSEVRPEPYPAPMRDVVAASEGGQQAWEPFDAARFDGVTSRHHNPGDDPTCLDLTYCSRSAFVAA